MGMVTKRIHQRTTDRLVVPVRAVTALEPQEVLGIVRVIVESTPARGGLLQGKQKLWLFGDAPGPWRIYFGPPARKDPNAVVRVWMDQLTVEPSKDGGQSLVTLELMKWKTVDGTLAARKDFERFRRAVGRDLAAEDPSYTLLGAAG